MNQFDKYQRTTEHIKDSVLEENRMLARKLAESQQSFELLKFVHFDKSINIETLNDIIVGCTGCLYAFMMSSERIISNADATSSLYQSIYKSKSTFLDIHKLHISNELLDDHTVVVYPIQPSEMLSNFDSVDRVVLVYPNRFFTEETLDFVKSFLIVNDVLINIVLMKEKMYSLIERDPLTHLLNRSSWEATLQKLITDAKSFFVLFMDIDHFKLINDVYGHQVGDEVLVFTSQWLMQHFRLSDNIYRMGGDEFAVTGNIDSEDLSAIEKKLGLMNQYFQKSCYDTFQFDVTLSIGVILTNHADTLEALYKSVDDLLYESKENGRNQITIKYDIYN